MAKIKFVHRRVNFADCGLDIDNNILQAPICECGCGNYMDLMLEDDQEVADFMYSMLSDSDCKYCAIFALMKDNAIMIGTNIDDELSVHRIGCENGMLNIDGVRDIQNECGFHCYGLLEQKDDRKSFRIVME